MFSRSFRCVPFLRGQDDKNNVFYDKRGMTEKYICRGRMSEKVLFKFSPYLTG